MTPSERVKAWRLKNPGRRAALQRMKYQNDADYREQYLEKQRQHYSDNLDESRRKNREKRAAQRSVKSDAPEDSVKRSSRYHQRKYGITLEEKAGMLAAQGGVCAICKTNTPRGRHASWAVDHCHRTNKVRGILCNNCNLAIGLFCDSPDVVKSALSYLELHHHASGFSEQGT